MANDLQLVNIKAKFIKPKKQDRVDQVSPSARDHIERLKQSIGLPLDNGTYYGVREAITVFEADNKGIYTINKGETRWLAATEIDPEMEIPCIIIPKEIDKKTRHMDQATENSIRRDLNIYERAMSINVDKENGLTRKEIVAIHGLSSDSMISKYNAVLKLNPSKLKLCKESYINDLNLVSKLAKINDDSVPELRQRLKSGESAKKVVADLLQKENPKPIRPKTYKLALTEERLIGLIKLLKLNADEILSTEIDINEIIDNRIDEIKNPISTQDIKSKVEEDGETI